MEVYIRHKKIIVLTKNTLKIRTERLINLAKVKTKEASLLLNKDSNTKNKLGWDKTQIVSATTNLIMTLGILMIKTSVRWIKA